MYFHLPENQKYFNTKRQFTLLNYSSGGPREESEQLLGILHNQNVTENFNVGIDYDLISSAGRYQNQKTQIHSATLFSSFQWKKYRIHANYTLNKVNNEESGGIDSLWYLGSKEYSRTQTIPVKLSDAYTKINSSNLYIVQEFRFGKFEEKPADEIANTPKETKSAQIKTNPTKNQKIKEKRSGKDRINSNLPIDTNKIIKNNINLQQNDTLENLSKKENINQFLKGKLKPNGLSFSHVLNYKNDKKWFSDKNLTDNYYSDWNALINTTKTNDFVNQKIIGNSLSAHYRYNDQFSARLSYYNEQIAFENNIIPDTLIKFNAENQPEDTILKKYLLNEFSNNNLSFFISSTLFNRIDFKMYSEYYLNGYKKENSSINLSFGYRLFGDNWIRFAGNYSNSRPDYFYERFSSNHVVWENKNLIRQEEWDGDIVLSSEKYRYDISVGYGQITGFIYFDTTATAKQYGKQLNIITVRANKKFTLGPFHSTTQFVYQKSTNDSLLSLPEFNLYQSLYYDKLFKFSATGGDLRVQAGIDYRFSSSFMADTYLPMTGMFYKQFDQKLADYHCLDVFINFAIKRAQLYLVYNYLNTALNNSYYFTSPYYPAPPAIFKFGISWTFYD